MRSIEDSGGLKRHMELNGINHELFVLMAEANWNEQEKQYNGVRSMARILGKTNTTITKYLRVYDSEIGRDRHGKDKNN